MLCSGLIMCILMTLIAFCRSVIPQLMCPMIIPVSEECKQMNSLFSSVSMVELGIDVIRLGISVELCIYHLFFFFFVCLFVCSFATMLCYSMAIFVL